jgi:hypothetical protein
LNERKSASQSRGALLEPTQCTSSRPWWLLRRYIMLLLYLASLCNDDDVKSWYVVVGDVQCSVHSLLSS